MTTRNPRKDPAPGDVLSRFGSTRTVVAVERNERGTIVKVCHQGTTTPSTITTSTISAWRSWAKHDYECKVETIGESL